MHDIEVRFSENNSCVVMHCFLLWNWFKERTARGRGTCVAPAKSIEENKQRINRFVKCQVVTEKAKGDVTLVSI